MPETTAAAPKSMSPCRRRSLARLESMLRPGRVILIAIAVMGWSLAAALVLLLVSRLSFFGIGLIGVGIWFICTRMELEKEGAVGHELTPDLFAQQIKARQEMSRSERAALRGEQTLMTQSARFFKHLGIGLTVIGLGGFVLYQL